ncbi:siroheme synthase CysG [Roseinatronobacter alkalisoli]|uniref:Siroheme synthase CysG n=1 Tax=Roseinatronobacter alkalisoli TaxID=3028235 RepID=A0ABT5T8P9_9RHOB|nr:siroheme synthase CysG [Roseinatronobacter sp. HJB301]MDD7970547.1 siroheme synthase CysG [Roseinatronobacter sp. HJB301]
MQHFPIYLDTAGADIAVIGNGAAALAKLRLLFKTQARITVFAPAAEPDLAHAVKTQGHTLIAHAPQAQDLAGMRLVYSATEDAAQDAANAALARSVGALVNIVDNLDGSDFITPAIVDRDPVVVAIGTEGAAPVLARAIKKDIEDHLPAGLGTLASAGKAFRPQAEALPHGRARRDFWADYYLKAGPDLLAGTGSTTPQDALQELLHRHLATTASAGRVDLVGAGPGNPELMTLRARRLLDRADVVIHDRLVTGDILELARREALFIAVGKEGFGPSTPQEHINALMIEHASQGAHVVRLKGGDAAIFARLDEETDALDAAGIDWGVTPGITAASAASAAIGRSLTRRGRNTGLHILTAHDKDGIADLDWSALARPDAVAAIYMGKRAARVIQGRLLMQGAAPATPVTLVENASHATQTITACRLETLAHSVRSLRGPVVMLLGLSPAGAVSVLPQLIEESA